MSSRKMSPHGLVMNKVYYSSSIAQLIGQTDAINLSKAPNNMKDWQKKGEQENVHDKKARNPGNKFVENFRDRTLKSQWELKFDNRPYTSHE